MPDNWHSSARCLPMVALTLILASCGDTPPRSADSSVVAAPDTAATVATAEPLRALGTEPFWSLDIDSTGLRFRTPEDTSGMRFPPNAPESDSRGYAGLDG